MDARILVVDDDPQVRETVAEFLRHRGYVVITASNGVQAVTAVQEQRPSLVLLDLMMPAMDGLDAVRGIRQVDPEVGIVMLTGVHDESKAREAMRLSAYDYVTKPIDFAYLELAILTGLARAETAADRGSGAD